MAKRPNRALNQIIEGVSQEKVIEANRIYEMNRQAMLNKTPFIELPLGTRMVPYELITIAPDQIQETTQVLESNARHQDFLCYESLADITETMKDSGQQFPAIGQRKQGSIIVIDGSRRRASCILTNQPFLIYVTDEDISEEEAVFQSNTGNAHKPLSVYEQGLQWKSWIDSGNYKDAKSLALSLNKSDSLVYDAVNAVSIPIQVLKTFPVPGDLGRPALNQLRKLIKKHGADSVLDAANKILSKGGVVQVKGTNQKHLDYIRIELKQLEQTNSKDFAKIYYGKNDSKATIRKTKQGAYISLEKLSRCQLDAVDNVLQNFLNNS
tara:strand:- start:5973 stop:6944 length:972 start_codon:yes stop_codon:yes gene_type:complete